MKSQVLKVQPDVTNLDSDYKKRKVTKELSILNSRNFTKALSW